ncbi:LDLR class B repeat [Trinorchestia longiramus]|nr:LDLR class B repeat [Trinorchestia longiramus]
MNRKVTSPTMKKTQEVKKKKKKKKIRPTNETQNIPTKVINQFTKRMTKLNRIAAPLKNKGVTVQTMKKNVVGQASRKDVNEEHGQENDNCLWIEVNNRQIPPEQNMHSQSDSFSFSNRNGSFDELFEQRCHCTALMAEQTVRHESVHDKLEAYLEGKNLTYILRIKSFLLEELTIPCLKIYSNADTSDTLLSFKRCGDGHCIPVHWRCDGYEDCSVSTKHDSDEDNCDERDCSSGDYRCGNGRCVLMAFVCDGNDDCHDNTDEMFCDTICHNVSALNVANTPLICATTCNASLTQLECEQKEDCTWCGDSVCFASYQLCDGIQDCPDDADEALCGIAVSYQCSTDEFLCEEELRCIPKDFLCDGSADCFDHSDEANCSTISCRSDEWQCASGWQCIMQLEADIVIDKLQSYHCNGSPDCDDESDEHNCSDSASALNGSGTRSETAGNGTGLFNPCLAPAVMSCDGSTKCLLPHDLCDGIQLCDDGTDEGGRCGSDECSLLWCVEGCVQTPLGPLCTCPEHTTLLEDGVTCSAPPHPCDVWGTCHQVCVCAPANRCVLCTCHQLCHRVKGGHKCGCHDGFILEPDGFTCKSTERREPYLVFCNRHELHRLSITSNVSSVQYKPLLKGLKNAVALDFWHTDEGIDHLFWTDVTSDQIFTGTLYAGTLYAGSLSNIHVVLSSGIAAAEGLALDWMGQNLYWVVRGKRSSLQVAQLSGTTLSGTNTKTLIDKRIHSPRAIALDPRDGLMFWTDWEMHKSRIERATMSGGDRRVIVAIGGLKWPNGLTLDYLSRRLYWIDAKSDSIHTVLYDGSDPRMILHAHDLLSHPFAITLYGTQVFWTDWRTNSLMSANKFNGSHVSVLRRTITQPFDVVLVHPSRQPRGAVNACSGKGGCSHLCLLSGPGTRECHCPQEMTLLPNSTRCTRKETIIFLSLPEELRGFDFVDPSSAFIHHVGPSHAASSSRLASTHAGVNRGAGSVGVRAVGQLDYDAAQQWVYWTEPFEHEVRRIKLDGSRLTEILLDTGLANPRGLAIDWVSGNMFIGQSLYNLNLSGPYQPVKVDDGVEVNGSGYISVCKLDGSFMRVLETVSVTFIPYLAVDPFLGVVYFIDIEEGSNQLKFKVGGFSMTGKTFSIGDSSTSNHIVHPGHLTFDLSSKRLYWIDLSTGFVVFYNPKLKTITSLRRVITEDNPRVFGLSIYAGYFYYGYNDTLYKSSLSSDTSQELVTADAVGATSVVIYHQRRSGSNSCNGNSCAHLCLPTPDGIAECVCAEGYTRDPRDETICVAAGHVLVYASQKGLSGFILQPGGHFESGGLPVISRLGAVDVVSSDVRRNILVVADSDAGTVTQMWRDGTNLKTLVSGASIAGLAVDWISGNVYWSGSNSISVCRLNDTRQYVLLHSLNQPKRLALHPAKGKLFWAESGVEGGIYSSQLDGSKKRRIFHYTGAIGGITVDLVHHTLYWSDSTEKRLRGSKLDGSGVFTVVDSLSGTPTTLALHDLNLYFVMIGGYKYNSSIAFVSVAQAATLPASVTRVFHTEYDTINSLTALSESLDAEYNDCAESNGGCQDLCLYDGVQLQCRCFHASLASDLRSCHGHPSYMVYADGKKLSSLHLYDDDDVNLPQRELPNITARSLSIDYTQSRLYYTVVSHGAIRSTFLNGTVDRVFVTGQGLMGGLALEPAERRLYWTCESAAAIKMAALDEASGSVGARTLDSPRVIHRIVQLDPKKDRPSNIALDYCHRNIYWSNWHSTRPLIQRADYDGAAVTKVIETAIVLPNTLAVDAQDGKLYWGDARLNKIERCNLDGSHRTVVSVLHQRTIAPFDLQVLDSSLFWGDLAERAFYRTDKYSGHTSLMRRFTGEQMTLALVAPPNLSCADTCPLGHHCSDYCQLNPETGNPVCSCHSGRVRVDRHSPVCRDCDVTEINCGSSYCIPYEQTCNGVAQCPDASDEDTHYCSTRECKEGFFSCGTGRCIAMSRVCDRQHDCPDWRDERNCSCDTDAGHFLCSPLGICLPPELRCNAMPDCPDVSDEIGCPPVNCSVLSRMHQGQEMVQCVNTTRCILPSWRCDGSDDCWDNSDEEDCDPMQAAAADLHHRPACLPGYHKCHTGLCIQPMFVCDFEDDCGDGGPFEPSSDESNCNRTCQEDEYQCGDGSCIMRFWQCDGSAECPDGSDEADCSALRACNDGWVRCNVTMRCIPPNWICDGDDDCGGPHPPEDEDRDCTPRGTDVKWADITEASKDDMDSQEHGSMVPISCSPGHFACPFFSRTQYLCVAMQFFCDGEVHCLDGSDEPSHCTVHTCPQSHQFRCRNNNCISSHAVCNMNNDCGDFSDEENCREYLFVLD